MTLSVIVLTHNEEKHIRACLASVRDFADELLVLDSDSTDETAAIASEMGARVNPGRSITFPISVMRPIELARGDWIFFIDADERATLAVGRKSARRLLDRLSVFGFRGAISYLERRFGIPVGRRIISRACCAKLSPFRSRARGA